MINAKEKLQEVREISANVAEYIDSELYRFEIEEDIEWSDFEILTYCIPIIVSEIQELGVYIALDDSDYLTEWVYSDGIIALRQLLDKENLPLFFKNNIEHINDLKNIFSNVDANDDDLIKDLLELMITKNLGDPYQLDRIKYISDYVYSDLSFKEYINYLLGNVNNISTDIHEISENINNIEEYKNFVNGLNDIVIPLWNQTVNDLIRLGINIDTTIISKMEKEYLEEYLSSSYTSKYIYIMYNTIDDNNILNTITKDVRIRLQLVLPYSISNYLIKKDIYTLLMVTIHYGTIMKLYKIVCDVDATDPNTWERYNSCYQLLKYSTKLGKNRDIQLLLENIHESNISLTVSEYLEDLLKNEGVPV